MKFERNAMSYLPMLLRIWASDHLTFRSYHLYSLCCCKDFTFVSNLAREYILFENWKQDFYKFRKFNKHITLLWIDELQKFKNCMVLHKNILHEFCSCFLKYGTANKVMIFIAYFPRAAHLQSLLLRSLLVICQE